MKVRGVFHFFHLLWRYFRGKIELTAQLFIDSRWETCQHCPYMKRGWFRYFCEKCGCTLGESRSPFNKLAYPCEECPLRKWTKVIGAEQCHDKCQSGSCEIN